MIRIDRILQRSVVGGKAHRLSVLHELGIRVPSAYVFDMDDVAQIRIDGVHVSDIEILKQQICDQDSCAAVRSSAEDEDGTRTWAGQFETVLFVDGHNLAKTIVQCTTAVDSDAVLAYAEQHRVPVPKLAIIVQKMVDAKMAGVLFTKHPTNNVDVMVLEVISGVGEALVSGEREPRRYMINRAIGTIEDINGASEPEVSDAILAELYQIGLRLAAHFGIDQDIEWAVDANDTLHIVQCRNITVATEVIEQIRDRAIVETRHAVDIELVRLATMGYEGLDVLSDQNIAELLTPHPCTLSMGLFNYGFAHGHGGIRTGRNEMGYEIGSELDSGFFSLVSGQPRCSIVHDALTYRVAGIPLRDYWTIVRHYLSQIKEDPKFANYPEILLYEQDPDTQWLQRIFGQEKAHEYRGCYNRFFERFRMIEDCLDTECRHTFEGEWHTHLSLLERAHTSYDLVELTTNFHLAAEALRTVGCRMFVKVARVGFFAFARLRRLLIRLFADRADEYINTLTSGISPDLNPNMQFNIELARLRNGETTLQNVVQRFGHLGYHELEISHPRYEDDPKLVQEIADRIQGDPKQNYQEQAQTSSNLQASLRAALCHEDASVFDREVDLCRRYLPLREVVKFEYLRAYAILRRLAVQMNNVLGWDEGLIFHLNPEEIFILRENTDTLQGLALKRQETWNAYRQIYTPQVIWSDDLQVIGSEPNLSDGENLHGVGVTNFISEGTVVIMRDLGDKEARKLLGSGVVLVTVTTDPAWSPVLSMIGKQGSLITEIGGLLAHGAVYAREMGIAAVLNVPNATSILKTGMRVRVHGPQGIIEILKQ